MKVEKYLPIGSVVMLKEGKKRIMIVGYLPIIEVDGEKKGYDYSACLYPEGIISSTQTLVFNHDQIDNIYFIGNNDGETKEFLDSLKDVDLKAEIGKIEKEDKKESKTDLIIED